MRNEIILILICWLLSSDGGLNNLVTVSSAATVRGAEVFMDVATYQLTSSIGPPKNPTMVLGLADFRNEIYYDYAATTYGNPFRDHYSDL